MTPSESRYISWLARVSDPAKLVVRARSSVTAMLAMAPLMLTTAGANVFPFSAATAASETLQLLSAVIAPGGIGDVGGQLYHFTTGTLDRRTDGCLPGCPYAGTLLALGDVHPFDVTGDHSAASAARRTAAKRPATRLARKLDDFLWRLL